MTQTTFYSDKKLFASFYKSALSRLKGVSLLYGILMLAVRRYLGLVLLWVTAAIVFFITVMMLPVREVSVGTGSVAVVRTVSPISVGLLAIAVAAVGSVLCIVLHRLYRKKRGS